MPDDSRAPDGPALPADAVEEVAVDEVAAAERAAAALAVLRRDGRRSLLVQLACVAVVAGLLLPWSSDRESARFTRDAFGRSAWPVLFGLATVGAVLVLLAVYRTRPRRAPVVALRWVGGLGAVVGVISTAAVSLGHQDGDPVGQGASAAAGPWTFVLGLLAVAVLTHWVGRDGVERTVALVDASRGTSTVDRVRAAVADAVRVRPVHWWDVLGAAFGGAGAVLAVAAMFTPWQRLSSPALDELVGSRSVVWTGLELSVTVPVRWALPAAALLVTLGLLLRTRVAVFRLLAPLTLLGLGFVLLTIGSQALTDGSVSGLNATFGTDAGPALTVAAGALCIAGGALTLGPRPHRGRRRGVLATAALAAALAAALTAATLGANGPRPARAGSDGNAAVHVLNSDRSVYERVGGPALEADVNLASYGGNSLFDLRYANAVSTGAGVFFLSDPLGDDRDDVLMSQVVEGRALPVTLLHGGDEVQLIDVLGSRAIVLARSDRYYSVVSIDLHRPTTYLSTFGTGGLSGEDHSRQLLTTAPTLPTSSTGAAASAPGRIEARNLDVQRAPDGGMLLADSALGTAYRVDAATVRNGAPWRHLTHARYADLAGPGTTGYRIGSDVIDRVDADGTVHPVVGGVSDARCTLSRDPLSSALDRRVPIAGHTVDAGGNLWFVLRRGGSQLFQTYVRTSDGVLRRPAGPLWREPGGMQAMPDGSLLVVQYDGHGHGGIYRIASADGAARAAAPLGPVPAGCVSDNRVQVPSLGRSAHRAVLADLPRDDENRTPEVAVVDTRGTRVYARTNGRSENLTLVSLARPGRAAEVVRRLPDSSQVDDVVPDGRGGAWWSERSYEPTRARLGHVTAAGTARVLAPLAHRPRDNGAALTVVPDTGDGSVWSRWSDQRKWTRTTLGGSARELAYSGTEPVVRDGHGYAQAYDRNTIVALSGSSARTSGVLGGATPSLALPAAVASHSPADRVLTTGQLSITRDGGLVLHQGEYLARVGRNGRLTVLSTVADRLPDNPSEYGLGQEWVFGHTLVIYDDDATMWTVDVS